LDLRNKKVAERGGGGERSRRVVLHVKKGGKKKKKKRVSREWPGFHDRSLTVWGGGRQSKTKHQHPLKKWGKKKRKKKKKGQGSCSRPPRRVAGKGDTRIALEFDEKVEEEGAQARCRPLDKKRAGPLTLFE